MRVLEICNKKGLHARASAKFVQTVERFDAEVRVTRGGETVGGTSIMGLMMLAAGPGTSITVEATGAGGGRGGRSPGPAGGRPVHRRRVKSARQPRLALKFQIRHKEIFISSLRRPGRRCYRHAPRRPVIGPGFPPAPRTIHESPIEDRQSRRHGLRRQGHQPGRMGPQGNLHRRDRDARPDGDARGVRAAAAVARRPRLRLAAHDDPDRRADRDARGARRRRALGLVQHLFDPGPRRRRDRGHRHAGVRRQGREPGGVLGLHPPHLRMGGRRHPEPDPRRRRRRHHAGPSRHPGRQEPVDPQPSGQRGRGGDVRRHQEAAEGQARLVRRRSARTSRASPRRPRPACTGSTRWRRTGACCSRRSTSTTASPNRNSTISTAAANRWSTAFAAAPT